ncbi:hypothetical protein HHK36_026712 [Tetracentron sinense]|uniref:Sas10 C-terminal domain-containing protein n=1 Tax=Tetracentron sinense TaxID=13715 RepID=A0A834YJ84_TETSI|nr:hypothetical protein HHK36_026712 [Tetracentron sinense]
MGKGGKRQKKYPTKPRRRTCDDDFVEKDMDDEIEAFHKQRDIIPLDLDGDIGASDEYNVQPVFDFEDDDDDDDTQLTGLAAKKLDTEMVDEKRQISYQLKHQKAVVRWKGQVREIRRPNGPYGGEISGINAGISRSIRFKN